MHAMPQGGSSQSLSWPLQLLLYKQPLQCVVEVREIISTRGLVE